jgi:hypothetical protein
VREGGRVRGHPEEGQTFSRSEKRKGVLFLYYVREKDKGF